jgi:hypothetical protein
MQYQNDLQGGSGLVFLMQIKDREPAAPAFARSGSAAAAADNAHPAHRRHPA